MVGWCVCNDDYRDDVEVIVQNIKLSLTLQ